MTTPRYFTKHAEAKLRDLYHSHGISTMHVDMALQAYPRPSRNHPGQSRFCGGGVCLVVDDVTGAVITAYLDRVLTPLRPDQIAAGVTINRKG